MLGREVAIPMGATGDAQDGDLVAVETSRAPRFGLPTGRVVEKLGSLASERAVSLIAIHAHSIPHVFRRETEQEAGRRYAQRRHRHEEARRIDGVEDAVVPVRVPGTEERVGDKGDVVPL